MQKMNNKGLTIIEIVVTFSMIMFFCIGLLVIVNNYRNKVTVSLKKLDLDTFKNSITQDVNNDLLKQKYKLVEIVQASEGTPVGNCTEQLLSTLNRCINFKYYNTETGEYENRAFGTSKTDNTRQSYENKYIYYDGIKYPLKEKLPKTIPTLEDGTQRKYRDFQTITVMDDSILQETSVVLEDGTKITVYRIDVNISHLDFEDDFGIHIVATTDDAPTMKEPPNEENEPPEEIDSCQGCVYAYHAISKSSLQSASTPPENQRPWKMSQSTTNYGDGLTGPIGQWKKALPRTKLTPSDYYLTWQEAKAASRTNYFLGLVLDSEGYIEQAYVCGVKDNIPFCIQGSNMCETSNMIFNPNYYTNVSTMKQQGLYENSQCTSSGTPVSDCNGNPAGSSDYTKCTFTEYGGLSSVTNKNGYTAIIPTFSGNTDSLGCIIDYGLIYCRSD